jgi:hypothetical protein
MIQRAVNPGRRHFGLLVALIVMSTGITNDVSSSLAPPRNTPLADGVLIILSCFPALLTVVDVMSQRDQMWAMSYSDVRSGLNKKSPTIKYSIDRIDCPRHRDGLHGC